MKCIFLLAIVSIVGGQHDQPNLNVFSAFRSRSDYAQQCAKQYNINYTQLMHAPTSTWPQFNSPIYKKYFLCVTKHMGFIDEEGHLLKNEIRKSLTNMTSSIPGAQAVIDDMIEDCAVDKNSPEETAYNFITCAANYSRGRQ